jgi:voltage-gated potassium channel
MGLMIYEGQKQNVDPITAIYWVVETITTLGYGDIIFHSAAGRLFTIIVSVSGLFILWAVVLPFEITPRIEKLAKVIPTAANPKMTNHIIICGYNPMVESLTKRLSMLKMPFLIIERSEEVARRIYQKYPTVLGDPADHEVLVNSNLEHARMLIANETEELNAEVIMAVRDISDIEVIAIVDDLAKCQVLSYAGASRAISPKTLLGNFIAQIAVPSRRQLLPGAIPIFGDLLLVELPIYPGSELIGKSLNFSPLKESGADIVGIWQKGAFKPNPEQEDTIQLNSVLMAVGDKDHLSKIMDLTIGSRGEGPIIIVGYGDVGRQVARAIYKSGINPTVVDLRALGEGPFNHVTGDGTSEEALVQAGIKDAFGTLVMLDKDPDVIYSTLLIRNLNPNTFIVARANRTKSAEKIYRAGADYVASVPIIASHMLAKIAQGEEEELDLLHEDLEVKVFKIHKGSGLERKTLGSLDIPGRFGCGIVAIERDGQANLGIDTNTVLKQGDSVAIIGSPEEIVVFARAYNRKPALRWVSKHKQQIFSGF